MRISRRSLLTAAAGAGAFPVFERLDFVKTAHATPTITGVEWGGSYMDAFREIVARQQDVSLRWELHASGAAAILGKLKTGWPNVSYDFIAAYDPVFSAMKREGWVEPIDPDLVPNLRHVPKNLTLPDAEGRAVVIPRGMSGFYFGYRPDIAPVEIASVDDLLSPKLRGQICWPHPVQMSGLHILALARHNGGDERNIEPGWEMLKEIAKAGNIGRVAQTEVEFINSVSSGETSVSFWHLSAWSGVAKNAPVVHLTKRPGFTTYLTTTGWVVLPTSKSKEATQRFLNFCLEPDNLALYSRLVGEVPASSEVPVDPSMEQLKFSPEESEQFTNLPDWEFLSTSVGEWTRRWETEIVPLL